MKRVLRALPHHVAWWTAVVGFMVAFLAAGFDVLAPTIADDVFTVVPLWACAIAGVIATGIRLTYLARTVGNDYYYDADLENNPVPTDVQEIWDELVQRARHYYPLGNVAVVIDPSRGPSAELLVSRRRSAMAVVIGPRLAKQPRKVICYTLAVELSRLLVDEELGDTKATTYEMHLGCVLYAVSPALAGLGLLAASDSPLRWLLNGAALVTLALGSAYIRQTENWRRCDYYTADRVAARFLNVPLTDAIRTHIQRVNGWEYAWAEPDWDDPNRGPGGRHGVVYNSLLPRS